MGIGGWWSLLDRHPRDRRNIREAGCCASRGNWRSRTSRTGAGNLKHARLRNTADSLFGNQPGSHLGNLTVDLVRHCFTGHSLVVFGSRNTLRDEFGHPNHLIAPFVNGHAVVLDDWHGLHLRFATESGLCHIAIREIPFLAQTGLHDRCERRASTQTPRLFACCTTVMADMRKLTPGDGGSTHPDCRQEQAAQ